jgi:hypothetical protein
MQREKNIDKVFLYGFLALSLLCCGALCCVAGISLLLVFSSSDSSISSNPVSFPSEPISQECTEADCLRACLYKLPEIDVQVMNSIPEIEDISEEIEIARYRASDIPTEAEIARSPSVPEYLQIYQDDIELHQKIWNYYQRVFPYDKFTKVEYLIIYTDGTDYEGTAAQVSTTNDKWELYVDILDFEQPEATYSLAHEYGHIITLNELEISEYYWDLDSAKALTEEDFDKEANYCEGFFTGDECTYKDSYLDKFGKLFWSDIYEEWKDIYIQYYPYEDGFYDATYEFYQKYSDQFVTDYAASSPSEDIAESLMEFFLSPKPTGSTIADQKVLFFYQFPELVEDRTTIIQNTCQFAAEQQKP